MDPHLDYMEMRLNGGNVQALFEKMQKEQEEKVSEAVDQMREQLFERQKRAKEHLEGEVNLLNEKDLLASCKGRIKDLQRQRDEAEETQKIAHVNNEQANNELNGLIPNLRNLRQRTEFLQQQIATNKSARREDQALIFGICEEGCKKAVGITASKRKGDL